MRRPLESRYALAESVELCLEEHESNFAADVELREARCKLREQLRTVCLLARDPRQPRRGLTGQRRKVRDLLVHALVELHGIMHAWASATQNDRVREQTRNAPYRVHRLPDGVLREEVRKTRALLEKYRLGLEKYGMDDSLRQAFSQLQKEFERSFETIPSHPALWPQAESPALAHDEALNDLIRHIRDVLDPLVWRYQDEAPRFVRAYRSARRVVTVPGAAPLPAPGSPSAGPEETLELLG